MNRSSFAREFGGRLDSQPSSEVIGSELDAYERWRAAFAAKSVTLPDLPEIEGAPSTPLFFCGAFIRLALVVIGSVSGALNLQGLREWAAAQRVRIDFLSLEPVSCSLNRALTELGLAAAARGDMPGALECLDRSWRVHPCPHTISFGLDRRLWVALAGIPEAENVRSRYAEIAKRFCYDFGRPRRKLTLSEILRVVFRRELTKRSRRVSTRF
jgi:hypothetical protein